MTLKEVAEQLVAHAKEQGEMDKSLTINWEACKLQEYGSTYHALIALSDGSVMEVDIKLPTH